MKIKPILKNKIIFKFILFTCVSFFILSCEKSENLNENSEVSLYNSIRDQFIADSINFKKSNHLNNLNFRQSLKRIIHWHNSQNSNDTIYFPISLQLPNGYRSSSGNLFLNNQVWLQATINEETEKYSFKMLTILNSEIDDNIKFNGLIIYEDFFIGNTELLTFKNGISIKQKVDRHFRNSSNEKIGKKKPLDCKIVTVGKACIGDPTDNTADYYCYPVTEEVCSDGSGGFETGGSETGGSSGYPPDRVHGGGGNGGSTNAPVMVVNSPSVEIPDLQKRLECFNRIPNNSGTKYKITLHSELADYNVKTSVLGPNNSVGHAFITLEKTNGTQISRLTFGFYPNASIKTPFKGAVPSSIGNDGESITRVSNIQYTQVISQSSFQKILNASINLSKLEYDLNYNNCTDYAVNVFNSGMASNDKLTLLSSKNPYALYDNPSTLYLTLEKLKTSGNSNITIGSNLVIQRNSCN